MHFLSTLQGIIQCFISWPTPSLPYPPILSRTFQLSRTPQLYCCSNTGQTSSLAMWWKWSWKWFASFLWTKHTGDSFSFIKIFSFLANSIFSINVQFQRILLFSSFFQFKSNLVLVLSSFSLDALATSWNFCSQNLSSPFVVWFRTTLRFVPLPTSFLILPNLISLSMVWSSSPSWFPTPLTPLQVFVSLPELLTLLFYDSFF